MGKFIAVHITVQWIGILLIHSAYSADLGFLVVGGDLAGYNGRCGDLSKASTGRITSCGQAAQALNTKAGETLKAVINGSWTAAATTLAIAGGDAVAACSWMPLANFASNTGVDLITDSANKASASETLQKIGTSAVTAAVPYVSQLFGSGSSAVSAATSSTCVTAAATFGVQTAMNIGGALHMAKYHDDAIVPNINDQRINEQSTTFTLGGTNGQTPVSGVGAGTAEKPEELCKNINCLEKRDPELQALTSGPASQRLAKELGVNNLRDWASQYKGDGSARSIADFIGNTMNGRNGRSGADISKGLQAIMAKTQESLNLNDPKGTSALAYASANKSKSSGNTPDEIPDFKKMMDEMLRKMMAGETSTKLDRGPASSVDRDLERLGIIPESQHGQQSDISIFSRVTYRYRKTF